MGLLDDAIREHLELKRRRGADASEVSKQEHEAFGPVRREEIAVDIPGEDGDPGFFDDEIAETRPVYEAEPETFEPAPEPESELEAVAYEPEPAPAPEPAPEPAAYEPPPREAPPVYEPPPERTLYESPERTRASAEPLPPVEEEPPPPAEDPQATVAFTALPEDDEQDAPEDVVPADEEPPADELEETPDFLQETPEHDRLWFEQKPPRDFDF